MYKAYNYNNFIKIVTHSQIIQKRLLSTSQPSNIAKGFFTSVWKSRVPTQNEIDSFFRKTSKDTLSDSIPPARSTMLLRDFIDDSLYNPSYGFYSKHPQNLNVEYEEMEQEEDHIKYMTRLAKSQGRIKHRHVHHSRYTLTELFKPWFGYAVAKYLVSEYKLHLYPHKDLIIYEIAGESGRLMPHILDYIERYEPSIYKRTQYNMIELSDRVSSPSFLKNKNSNKHDFVQVLDKNIFDWNTLVTEQCFFLGMEVINRFAHDVIRYNLDTLEPYQGVVCIDEKRNYTETFEPVGQDETISRYLALRKKIRSNHVIQHHSFTSRSLMWHKIQNFFQPNACSSDYLNYTYPEFIPTKLFQFMEILNAYFPGHRLILTDYDALPNTIEGINAPTVQTMYKGSTVPCNTYLLPPGWFDIIFPTNFDQLKTMYLYTCRATKAGSEKRIKSVKYDTFMERYGDIEKSKSKKGAPMRFMHQPDLKVFLT